MLGKHFTTMMSVICVMVLLLAVTRTEASPVLGNDILYYQIDKIILGPDGVCSYNLKQPCLLLTSKDWGTHCEFEPDSDGGNRHVCEKPTKMSVGFRYISDTDIAMIGLLIPNKYADVIQNGIGRIKKSGKHALLRIQGGGHFHPVIVSMTPLSHHPSTIVTGMYEDV
eukprot:Nk52_evm17s289 gene=Nk52_evmTU17s289